MKIQTKITPKGLTINVKKKDYKVEFPREIWTAVPKSMKNLLAENIAFTHTNYLSVLYDEPKIEYNTERPIFEPFFSKNQTFDMIFCEVVDKKPHLSYLNKYYNAEFKFKEGEGSYVPALDIPSYSANNPVAILPFSFGKESLTTAALCKELGIEPILMYVQEPSQGYEDAYKKVILRKLSKKLNFTSYRIINEPALFRMGVAQFGKATTELGWGTQTTDYIFYAIPLAFKHHASMLLFGSEYSNNEVEEKDGWKVYSSFDQTTEWSHHQNNIARLLTNGQMKVNTSLEPLEEIHIFYILHHRYPEIGKLQFSCSAESPLYKGSQWCHKCYKCSRMFVFAMATGIDPYKIGYKRDLLQEKGIFDHYFGDETKTGSSMELDFVFSILDKKNINSPYIDQFRKKKRKYVKPYAWYLEHFNKLAPNECLPPQYKSKLLKIFKDELKNFVSVLPR